MRSWFLVLAVLGVSFPAFPALAQDRGETSAPNSPTKGDPEEGSPSDDLENDLLGDLDRLPPPKTAKPATKPATPASPGPAVGEDIGEGHPLNRIAARMRNVEMRLQDHDTSAGTRKSQQAIVDELSALIRQMNSQQSERQQPSGSKPTRPQGKQDSGSKPGDGVPQKKGGAPGKPELEGARPSRIAALATEVWGHLPERVRQQMQNASSEQYLTKYEMVIEQFYRRLAEERP